MSATPCELCATPVSDASVCVGCSRRLELALGDVPALVADLEVTLTRQAAGEPRVGSRGSDKPMPYDARASMVSAALRATLCSWVLLCAEEHYSGARDLPEDRVSAMAGWLMHEVGWLRTHVAAVEAHHEILDAIGNARRAVDRPADRVFVGVCSNVERGIECTEQLYAKQLAHEVRCRICGSTHSVEARRKVLRASVDDVLARPAEIARAVVWLGENVRKDQISRWVQAKRLVAKAHLPVGEDMKPLYRIGDVLDLLAKDTKVKTSA